MILISYTNDLIPFFKDLASLSRKIQLTETQARHMKSDRSPVTVADYAIQVLVTRFLRERTPDIPIVAEESAQELMREEGRKILDRIIFWARELSPGITADEVIQALKRDTSAVGDRCWVLDPIDGTRGFLRGDQYAIVLALIERGKVTFAMMACPNLCVGSVGPGVMAWGQIGERAKLMALNDSQSNAKVLYVSTCADITKARMLISFESAHMNGPAIRHFVETLGITVEPFRMDSQAKYLLVAAGEGEIYLRIPPGDNSYPVENVWDHAAGELLVTLAGGRVTDLDGRPLDYSTPPKFHQNFGVLGTNGILHSICLEGLERVLQKGKLSG